jgi:hypothetical protein
MPITRRKRANPPDQPENNSHQPADQNEGAVEQPLHPEPAPASPFAESAEPAGNSESPSPETFANAGMPQPQEMPTPQEAPAPQELVQAPLAVPPPVASSNGDRSGPDYTPGIEGSRRTSRGELFRRPPQAPQPQASFVASTPLQAPTHEISLPLGNLLHLAYNPGYTGAEEARSLLLHRLSEESKAGGRARCWNCGSLAIAYDRWNTRSRALGEIGIAFCEICGVWSVM